LIANFRNPGINEEASIPTPVQWKGGALHNHRMRLL